jgi:hypothetical protein
VQDSASNGSASRMSDSSAALGANLGANRCGRLWTGVDAHGLGSLWFRAVWTAVDGCGHCLEIYGSGGWGFEFVRACY